MSQAQKRKHTTLTIKEKSEILDRLNRNETLSSLANEYGVGRATIFDIRKNQEKIKNYVTTESGPCERKTLKKAANPEVDEALYMWFLQERNRQVPITGTMLAMKAKYFYNEITKKDDFVASNGWLERFKSRHGIRLVNPAGNKLSNDETCIELFKMRFLQKVKDLDLSPSQVYNADESGLFWRVLDKTDNNCAPERRLSKERVTILPCANAAGTHALKMVVIGKSNVPHEFKNINLLVHCYGQKMAWMTKDLFKKWFDECFVPEVKTWLKENNLPQRALLLLDNAPGHPSEEELTTEDESITAMFIPPNLTALIQPMNQKIIEYIKQDYKYNLLLRAVSISDQPVDKTLKEYNMKDFIFGLCQSWNALSSSAIASSWKKLWPEIVTTGNNDLQISVSSEVIEQVAAQTQITAQELQIWFLGMDKEENIFNEMSDEDIIKVSSSKATKEEREEGPTTSQVSPEDAVTAFDMGLRWAEENGVASNDLLVLRRLRGKALVSRCNNLKQEKNC